jgi:hypothetical protein
VLRTRRFPAGFLLHGVKPLPPSASSYDSPNSSLKLAEISHSGGPTPESAETRVNVLYFTKITFSACSRVRRIPTNRAPRRRISPVRIKTAERCSCIGSTGGCLPRRGEFA